MSIPREHRLRRHAEFEVVYRCGQRHFSPSLTAFYLLRSEAESTPAEVRKASGANSGGTGEPRIGITVGRFLGKSIVRNRIKRRVRAAAVQNLGRLTRPLDVVINPKRVVLEIEFQKLCAEVARAFDVVEQKAEPGKDKDRRPALRQPRSAKPERLAARRK